MKDGGIFCGLKKSTVKIVILCIIALAASFFLCVLGLEDARLTSGTIENKKIVIDAGHGGFDAGAKSANGLTEDGINLDIAKKLESELETRGAVVAMTREDESALAPTKKADMLRRREMIESDGVDAVVSIHMNAFTDRRISGHMIYYQKGSEQGRLLAQCVQDEMDTKLGTKARLANPGDYFILKSGKAPCIIVECGFLSNVDDEKKLRDDMHRKNISEAIAQGVMKYFETNNLQ